MEERNRTVILLLRDQAGCHFFLQIAPQDIALIYDHPNHENQHSAIANVIYERARKESTDPADQATECVMKGVRCDRDCITSWYRDKLDECVAAQTGNCNPNSGER